MRRLLAQRLVAIVPVLLLVSATAFFLNELSSVDPAALIVGPEATEEQLEQVRADRGLDEPAVERYVSWLGAAVTGDLGESLYTGTPVTTSLSQRLPVTLSLTLLSMLVAIVAGVPLGILSAVRSGSVVDRAATGAATIGQAIPNFWFGLLLVALFAIHLGWLPAVGYAPMSDGLWTWLSHLLLPAVALGTAGAAALARHTRSAMIGVLQQDYIRAAIARGIPVRRVISHHALKNAAIPVVTSLSFLMSMLLGGSVVIERVFGLPGLGSLAVDAVLRKDPAVLLGFVLLIVVIVLAINLLLDLSYGLLNPKIRVQ